MNIIYVSCTSSKKKFDELFRISSLMPGQQVQKYHRLIMEGIALNGIKIKTITALPLTSFNCEKKIVISESDEENGVTYNYLPTLNFPIVKNVLHIVFSFLLTFKHLIFNRKTVVICDVLNISVTTGALLAAKLIGRKVVGIVTDIPILLSNNKSSFAVRFNNMIISHLDSYVFLTEKMNDLVNTRKVPYVVIEGQVSISMSKVKNDINNKYDKIVCIYAGGLNKRYGIEMLVNAFINARIKDAELHLFGNGDFEEELIEICRRNENIIYFGNVPNDVVVDAEIKATLLINPRPTNEKFTEYSFPSKNMEYMVSGTPVLTTKLPGMPKEYNDYVYIIENECVEGISRNLKDVLSIPREELHAKGMLAKHFVLMKKNNVVQSSKIIDIIG